MRTERFRGPAIAGGFGALVVLAVACMGKPDYPPYVESGSTGGNVSGGGGATTTTPVDAGLGDSDGSTSGGIVLAAGETCSTIVGNPSVCEIVESVGASGGPTCGAPAGTTCMTASLSGCCLVTLTTGSSIYYCFSSGASGTLASEYGTQSLCAAQLFSWTTTAPQ
jgi:hypothetical protein